MWMAVCACEKVCAEIEIHWQARYLNPHLQHTAE